MDKDQIKQKAHDLFLVDGGKEQGHYFHGRSMLPLFREGDRLLVRSLNWNALRVGDVIIFRQDLKYPTRRVVRLYNGAALVVGDNWITQRQLIQSDQIVSVVYGRSRDGHALSSEQVRWRIYKTVCLMRFRIFERADRLLRKLARRVAGLSLISH
jgi:hypothetical protein